MMQSISWSLLLGGFALAVPHGAAQANNCYFVYDRADNMIYRDQQPPVDMSDRGIANRDAMRRRGEYLLFVDTEKCAPIAFLTGPGTPGTLTVDQIVGGFPSMVTAQGVPSNSAKPGQGIAPSTRIVGASRGGVGVMRAPTYGKGK